MLAIGWSDYFQDQLETSSKGQIPVRIIGVRRNCFVVSQGDKEMLASMAGNLLHDREANAPAVGDWVLLRESVITLVLERKNLLFRKAAGGRDRKDGEGAGNRQVIAANLDTTFIVCGLDRDFNLRRIERYLTMVYNCGISPVVILTKADLHHCPESYLREVESIAFGVPVHLIAFDDDGSLAWLEKYLSPGKTVALIGSSGSGKSTLINRLYGVAIQTTSSVSQSIGKGRHTTTNRDLIVLPSGGMVIDNPGIREISLGAEQSMPESAFPDIENLAQFCRFPDCSHVHEPGCQVRLAVSSGEIAPARLKSYQKLQSELSYLSLRESKSSNRLEKERWKEVSQKIRTMKNIKRK